jgi:hypothetical protein
MPTRDGAVNWFLPGVGNFGDAHQWEDDGSYQSDTEHHQSDKCHVPVHVIFRIFSRPSGPERMLA